MYNSFLYIVSNDGVDGAYYYPFKGKVKTLTDCYACTCVHSHALCIHSVALKTNWALFFQAPMWAVSHDSFDDSGTNYHLYFYKTVTKSKSVKYLTCINRS